jgi:High potential iron-sulfur protein
MKESGKMTRRTFVTSAIVLPALAGLLAAETTTAQAKGSKASFKYQATPNNGQKCSGCALFIPGSSATANGTCKVVDGSISPNGWCTAFSAKPS